VIPKRTALLVSLLLVTLALSGCMGRTSYWGVPGIYGSVFLSEGEELVIEVDFMDGVEPIKGALEQFGGEVEKITGKDVRIEDPRSFTYPDWKGAYDVSNESQIEEALTTIVRIGEKFRDNKNDLFPIMSDTVYLYVLYLDGKMAEEKGEIPGMVFSADSICVFPESLDSIHFGLDDIHFGLDSIHFGVLWRKGKEVARENVETTVLLHEFGHLLGLARRPGLEGYQKLAPEHGKHCSNSSCVMYWRLSWAATGNDYDHYLNDYKHFCDDCLVELDSYRY